MALVVGSTTMMASWICFVTPQEGHLEHNRTVFHNKTLLEGCKKCQAKNKEQSVEGTTNDTSDKLEQIMATAQSESQDDDDDMPHFLQRMNAVMMRPHQELDWGYEEQSQKTAEDDDEEASVPSYVPQRFKSDLGSSLSHHQSHVVSHPEAKHLLRNESSYPVERAILTAPPCVPPPITRQHPVKLVVDMVCTNKKMKISGNTKFEYWPFGFYDEISRKMVYSVPGPFIRARVGDVLQVNFTNLDESGMAHSVDFHAVLGPGGGAPTTFAEQDETKVGAYLLQKPGLFVYHCAAAPIPVR